MAEMPELPPAGVDAIRTQGTLAKRKPPVADVAASNLAFGMNPAALEAEEAMAGMRNAFGITRQYNNRYAAIARAKNRMAEQALKNQNKAGERTRRKFQGVTQRRAKSAVLRNARDYLGMGTDLYR
jgi:hypothetical protein